jgi:hypothetical protein
MLLMVNEEGRGIAWVRNLQNVAQDVAQSEFSGFSSSLIIN